MKNRLLLFIITALLFSFSAVADEEATELNCEVEVNSDKITNGSKEIFKELKQSITDYMNTTKWTNATFGYNERIYCKLMLTLSSWDDATGLMKGDLQIQSQRPVFNSSYTTAVINFRDTKVDFHFETGQQLVFSELEMEDNLTAILNFWAYMIIGMDFDTFELNGGTPYYERAAQVVRLAQSSGESGWKAFEDNTHFNPYGAYEISKMMVEGMKVLNLPIVKYIQEDYVPFNPSQPDDWKSFHWNDGPFIDIVKPDGN